MVTHASWRAGTDTASIAQNHLLYAGSLLPRKWLPPFSSGHSLTTDTASLFTPWHRSLTWELHTTGKLISWVLPLRHQANRLGYFRELWWVPKDGETNSRWVFFSNQEENFLFWVFFWVPGLMSPLPQPENCQQHWSQRRGSSQISSLRCVPCVMPHV